MRGHLNPARKHVGAWKGTHCRGFQSRSGTACCEGQCGFDSRKRLAGHLPWTLHVTLMVAIDSVTGTAQWHNPSPVQTSVASMCGAIHHMR